MPSWIDIMRETIVELHENAHVPRSIRDFMQEIGHLAFDARIREPIAGYTAEQRAEDRKRLIPLDVAIAAVYAARDEAARKTVPTYVQALRRRIAGILQGLIAEIEEGAESILAALVGLGWLEGIFDLQRDIRAVTEVGDKLEVERAIQCKALRGLVLPQRRGPRYRRKIITRR